MTEHMNIALVFLAGLLSVLSPCVLPVIPIVVTGAHDDHKLRPVMIVIGLAITFTIMGILSSLFGSVIGSKMVYVEKAAGVLIVIFGILIIFNVNLFKHMGFFSNLANRTRGRLGGLFLGLTLGLIWIPCIGPMLSGVLTMVATQGKLLHGIFLLLVYSAGFAVPMLIAGYASQFFRAKIGGLKKFPYIVNVISGIILICLGGFILFKGILGFSA